MRTWVRHLTHGRSILPRWDIGVHALKSVLIDFDHDPARTVKAAEVPDLVAPIAAAIASLEREAGVAIPVQYMWTGNDGIWVQLFMTAAVDRKVAIEFALLIGSRWQTDKLRPAERARLESDFGGRQSRMCVEVSKQVMGACRDREAWQGLFRTASDPGEAWCTVDGGSFQTRLCRMPFARHQKSQGTALFVDSEGTIIEDQIPHLLSLHRQDVDLEAIVEACRPVRMSPVQPTAGDAATDASGEGLPVAEGSAQQHIRFIATLRGSGGVPESIDDILSPDSIPDGSTNIMLVHGRILDSVYEWLRHRRVRITTDIVLDLLRPCYAGPDKTEEVRRAVDRDLAGGRHLTVSPSGSPHPLVGPVDAVAVEYGLTATQCDTLLYLAVKAHGRKQATATNPEVAKSLGRITAESTPKQCQAAAKKITRAIAKLIAHGLVIRMKRGYEAGYSRYRVKELMPTDPV